MHLSYCSVTESYPTHRYATKRNPRLKVLLYFAPLFFFPFFFFSGQGGEGQRGVGWSVGWLVGGFCSFVVFQDPEFWITINYVTLRFMFLVAGSC